MFDRPVAKISPSRIVDTTLSYPRVSVIVTAFNVEAYIEESLNSIRSQSYENFECIVIDDASTDGTFERILAATAGDSRFKVIRSPTNTGPSGARNLGLKYVQGDALSFLDGDDVWFPDFLDRMVAWFIALPANAVGCFCWSMRIDEKSLPLKKVFTPAPGAYDLATFLRNSCPPGNGSSLMISTAHLKGQLFRDICSEDTIFWLELLSNNPGSAFYCLPETLVRYRSTPGSLTKVFNSRTRARIESFEYKIRVFLPSVDPWRRPWVVVGLSRRLLKRQVEDLDTLVDKWVKDNMSELTLRFIMSKDGIDYLILRFFGGRASRSLFHAYKTVRGTARRILPKPVRI